MVLRDRLGGSRTLYTLLAVCGASLVLAPAALGANFKVTRTADASPGGSTSDGVCQSVLIGSHCTLRAAIAEANGTSGTDVIQFSGSTVAGQTITTTLDALPALAETATIDGCSSDPDHVGPCVGLRNSVDTDQGIAVIGPDDVKVKGLAITNTSGGVVLSDLTTGAVVKNNWLGIELDGGVDGNAVGILVRGDDSQIGGDTSAERNVIAASTDTGIQIEKGDENLVQGNRLGTRPDGSVPAEPGDAHENAKNIEIVATGGDMPIDNLIGGTVSSSKAATAKCDHVCNLIVNSNGHGIDLYGDGGAEGPGIQTTIAGNYIGLSRTGSSDKGNAEVGVNAENTDETTIGGETSGARNFIAGNDYNSIFATGATAMDVKRNYIGFDFSGATAIPNGDGVVMNEGTFHRNRVGGNGVIPAFGIALYGAPTVTANMFGVGTGGQKRGFGDTAVSISGSQVQLGGDTDDEANTIGNGAVYGVWIGGGDGNDVEGNHIGTDPGGTQSHPNGAGVHLDFDADDNSIESNLISNSDNNAIEIVGDGNDDNALLSNIGKNNGGLFIDLAAPFGFGNGAAGPNGGIAAPVISTVENSGDMTVTGTSAAPDGTEVQIYRTKSVAGVSPNRIEAFVGIATVISGAWNTTFAHQPSGQRITALQYDDTAGFGSSELALSLAY